MTSPFPRTTRSSPDETGPLRWCPRRGMAGLTPLIALRLGLVENVQTRPAQTPTHTTHALTSFRSTHRSTHLAACRKRQKAPCNSL